MSLLVLGAMLVALLMTIMTVMMMMMGFRAGRIWQRIVDGHIQRLVTILGQIEETNGS